MSRRLGRVTRSPRSSRAAKWTLLKSIRSDNNQTGIWITGTATRSAGPTRQQQRPGRHQDHRRDNTVHDSRVFSNGQERDPGSSNSNTINKNKVGDARVGNGQDGINVTGASNTINENDVFSNGATAS